LISNDSDLEEPLRIIKVEFGKVVGLAAPILNPNRHLSNELKNRRAFSKRSEPQRLLVANSQGY